MAGVTSFSVVSILVMTTLTHRSLALATGTYKSISCLNGVCASDSSKREVKVQEDLLQNLEESILEDSFAFKPNSAFLPPNKSPRFGTNNFLLRNSLFGMLVPSLLEQLQETKPSIVGTLSHPTAFTYSTQEAPAKDTGGKKKPTTNSIREKRAEHSSSPSESQKKVLHFYNEAFLAVVLLVALSGTLIVGRHHIRSLWYTWLKSNQSNNAQSLRTKAH